MNLPRRTPSLLALTPAAVLALAAAASGQETSPAAAADLQQEFHVGDLTLTAALNDQRPWRVQIEPMLWWTSPSGKLRLPGAGGAASGDKVRVERLNLDTPRFSPAGEVHINADAWRFSFSAGAFSLSRDETTADASFQLGDVDVVEGDTLETDFDYMTAEVTAGYRFYRRDFAAHSEKPENAVPVLLSLYGLGGVRVYDLDIHVANHTRGGAAASDQFFVEPILGLRAELEIDHDFTIDLQISGGVYADSDRSVSSLDIVVGFAWQPTEHFGWQIGWRQILTWMEDGEDDAAFEYDGGLAGLYTGVVIRF